MTNSKKDYVQHFSTRIPWKDNDYRGRVDNNPRYNVAAQVIPNIASTRDLEYEEVNKGKKYGEIDALRMKNWITENAAFMSDVNLEFKVNHPYRNNERFSHYLETTIELKPYSFLLRPFSWTLKNSAIEKQKYHNFYFDLEETERMLNWSSAWVSHGQSQKGIFDYFFSGVSPNNSLIFPYYKQVPFIEDNRRIIAGIGNIASKVEIEEYASDGSRSERNYIWETNVSHSIRDNGASGFLMPYLEIYDYTRKNPNFDPANVTLFEARGFRPEFSYAAEWVSYDAAIDVLNQAKDVLKNIGELKLEKANLEWVNRQLEYVDGQLKNVWSQRGIYPGIGSLLSAFGLKYGFDIAKNIDFSNKDLISELKLYFSGDKEIGDDKLDDSLADREDEFNGLLRDEKKTSYFKILARLNLSIEQASFAWENRGKYVDGVLENPYLLFELTRKEKEEHRITISQIDNAMFINSLVEDKYPLSKPSKMRGEGDKRRFRAMLILVLEEATDLGHTLLSYNQIVEEINKLPLDRRTDFQREKIEGLVEFLLEGELYIDEENKYIKLKEYQEYKKIIADLVNLGLERDYESKEDWVRIIDSHFGGLKKGNEEKDRMARREKALALATIESSRLSILLGRAGTGKTETLGLLASSDRIRSGGVLALTPTGKSRIQLETALKKNKVEAEFMTVAQFLIRSGGFSWDTMSYRMPSRSSSSIAKTIIIDESSMLTEDMFAGIVKLVDPHAERIIFTGDPNQLPPIGAGRPFVDLINYIESIYPEKIARLITEMRQAENGDDLLFAQVFSNSESIDKDIIYRIQNNSLDNRLKFIQYKDLDDLEEIFFKEVVKLAKMKDEDDIDGFNRSLGAKIDSYTNYFTSKHIEDWQVLSPTRFMGIGSYYLNNQIHKKYRQELVDKWNLYSWAKNKPQSVQNIVFGDKVISNVNGERDCWDGSAGKEYIANGEIGIMSSYPCHYGKNDKNKTYYKFRFKSFEGKIFSYSKTDFGGESFDSKLELAYALTIHKSQGSSFGKTIIVIHGKNSFISKELLYTAFSRQKDELIVLSDITIEDLFKYSNDWYSDTKQRYTDLFEKPNIVEIERNNQKRYLEENLIHKTLRGEMVRSKSELIVANILDKLNIDYCYEEVLEVGDRSYIPDFTLRYQGKIAYLEHLGMLGKDSYKKSWDKKRKNYESAGISEANGRLITTEDGLDGSIDAILIEEKIQAWMDEV